MRASNRRANRCASQAPRPARTCRRTATCHASASALMLASSIADTYFGWQADQSRLALAREREITVQREAAVTAARIGSELDSGDESQRAAAALASAREQIAVLR